MATSLHVLILEDRAADAELVVAELREAGFAPEWVQVDNEADFLRQLDASLDLILADYALPQFDGLRALDLVQARGLDIPFIIVSGSIGEERAVRAIKQGATDYVLKDRLTRLGVAAGHALEQKRLRDEKRQAEEARRASEQRFRALIEHSSDAIALSSPDGTIIYASPGAGRILGVAEHELLGRNTFDGVHPDDLAAARELYNWLLQRPGATRSGQFRLRHRNGSWRWVEGTGTNLLAEPSVQAMLANYRDITERQKAEQELARRADEFAALYETTRDLTGQYDLTDLLQTIVERAMTLLQTDTAAMHLYDPVHSEVELAVSKGLDLPLGTRLKEGEGMAGRVAQARQPLVVDDYQTWEHRSPKYQGFPFRAILHVPMLYGGQLIGVLAVQEIGESTRKFTEPDARLLSLLAGVAAGAVHNARLLQETQVRAQQLGLLYDAGLALNSVLEPRVQLEFLFNIAVRALHAERAEFFRFDPSRAELTFELGIGYPENSSFMHPSRFKVGVERGLVGWAATQHLPVRVPDVRADPRYIALDPAVRSGLWVPVEHENQLLGVLSILSTRLDAFTAADERLIVLFANQAAVALENARLFEETHRRLGELEAISKISTVLRVASSVAEMIPVLLDETVAAVGTEAGVIFLYDPAQQAFTREAARGWYAHMPLPLSAVEGMGGHLLKTGQSYFSKEFRSDPIVRDQVRANIPAGWGGVCIPIRTTREIIGALFVSVQAPRELSPNEIQLLNTLAEMAGSAIHRMRLHQQTERQLRQVVALHTIDLAIGASFDLAFNLDLILDQVTRHLQVDAADILLYNSLFSTLDYKAARGFQIRGVELTRLRVGEDLATQLFMQRRTIAVPDLSHSGTPFVRAPLFANEGFVSYVAAPLVIKGQPVGVLEVFNRTLLETNPEWLDFLQALAAQTAIAIENASLFNDLQRSNSELIMAYDQTIEGWSRALDLRDRETEGHTQRVTAKSVELARALGIDEVECQRIRRGALLHDIGKMGIPDSILLKPGPLTDDEWVIMRKHPDYARDLLAPITYLRNSLEIPYGHHERWDGTGYPRGLKGEQIPLAARIFTVVDVWDALCSERPYRKAWPEAQVREHIREQSGRHFDPKIVEAFLRLIATE